MVKSPDSRVKALDGEIYVVGRGGELVNHSWGY